MGLKRISYTPPNSRSPPSSSIDVTVPQANADAGTEAAASSSSANRSSAAALDAGRSGDGDTGSDVFVTAEGMFSHSELYDGLESALEGAADLAGELCVTIAHAPMRLCACAPMHLSEGHTWFCTQFLKLTINYEFLSTTVAIITGTVLHFLTIFEALSVYAK